jgi:peroxidase
MSDQTMRSMVVCQSTVVSLLLCCGAAVAEDRSIDGSGNNVANPQWGMAVTAYSRVSPPAYGDGISTLSGADRPAPRIVSNAVGQQDTLIASDRHLSGFVYAFGQFLNHDLQLTRGGTSELMAMTTPSDDPHFHGHVLQTLRRSSIAPNTGLDLTNPRQQVNAATSFLDASTVYGSDQNRADVLRERVGDGLGAHLVTTGAENLLPSALTINVVRIPTDGYPDDPSKLLAAGDLRAGENPTLASLHTLFLREHNRLVDELAAGHPAWSQEELYQRARKTVGAQMQSITYNEFLPALLGPTGPTSQAAYDPAVDPSIINEFAAVFLRVGHSMLGNDFRRVTNDGSSGPMDHLLQSATIFNVPQSLNQSSDLDLYLKGLSVEEIQEVDTLFSDEQRNSVLAFVDLLSFDVARARDHGLADYNTMRVAYGLSAVTTFSEITTDPDLASSLEDLYGDVSRIDPLVGALAEDHLPGASVGPLAAAGLAEQFVRLRDGDRFWYETDPAFTAEEVLSLQNTRLSDIIRRNTGLTNLQDNVFFVSALPAPLDGDYNANGLVEQGDLDLVLGNWGAEANNIPPTWINDPPVGFIDQEELDGVLVNWGNQQEALGLESIPEPSSLLLVGLAAVAVVAIRVPARRRR